MEKLFKSVEGQISEENILDFNKVNFDKLPFITPEELSYDEVLEVLEKYSLNPENLRLINSFPVLWYVGDNGVYLPIHSLSEQMLRYQRVKETIYSRAKKLELAIKENDYEEYFRYISTYSPQFALYEFQRKLDDIPDDQKYRVLRNTYTRMEYGFDKLPQEVVESILEKQKGKLPEKALKELKKSDTGHIVIYRGTLPDSMSPDESLSWTTSLATAAFFATRFDIAGGKIFIALVSVSDVSDYINDRGEQEIVVLPKYTKVVREIFQYRMEDAEFQLWLEDNTVFPEFNEISLKFLKEELFVDANGIHGLKHTKRVLLLSLILGKMYELNSNDLWILVLAALYHDIGRTDDSADELHGLKSVQKLKELKLLSNKNIKETEIKESDIPIIEFLIEYHSRDDEDAIEYLSDNDIEDDRFIILYTLLKDAEALDRVRFNGLDTDMLRLSSSIEYVSLAHQLLSQI